MEQSGRAREIACLYSRAGRRIASAREGRESGGKREERGGGREQGEPGIQRRAAGIQLAVRPSADSAAAVRPSASALAVPLCSGRPPVCGLKPEPDLLHPSPLPPIDAADRLPRHHPLLLLHASPSSAAAPEPDLRSARLPIEASTCRLTPPSIRVCFLPLLCLSANALPSRQPELAAWDKKKREVRLRPSRRNKGNWKWEDVCYMGSKTCSNKRSILLWCKLLPHSYPHA